MTNPGVTIRPLEESDLGEADRSLAFGTFLGLPDPMAFMGDVRTRWAAEPTCVLAAEVDGRLVGTNFVTRWGSVGFFGPLTVDPSLWDKGVARALLVEGARAVVGGVNTSRAAPTRPCSTMGTGPNSSASPCTNPTNRLPRRIRLGHRRLALTRGPLVRGRVPYGQMRRA